MKTNHLNHRSGLRSILPIITTVFILFFLLHATYGYPEQKDSKTPSQTINSFLDALMQTTSLTSPYYEHYDISPDGRWAAFTIQRPFAEDDIYPMGDLRRLPGGIPVTFVRQDIWVAEIETGKTKRITKGKTDKQSFWHPVWAPNSRDLAFYGDHEGTIRLFICRNAVTDPEITMPDTFIIKSSLFRRDIPRWTARGHLLIPLLQERDRDLNPGIDDNPRYVIPELYRTFLNPEAGPTADVLSTRDPDDLSQTLSAENRADLGMLKAGSQKIRRLTQGLDVTLWELSPDRTNLAFKVFKEIKTGTMTWIFDLYVMELENGTPRLLMEDVENGLLWSPDGTRLLERKKRHLYAVDIRNGDAIRVTPEQDTDPVLPPPDMEQLSASSYIWGPQGDYILGRNKAGWRLFSADGSGSHQVFEKTGAPVQSIFREEGRGHAFSPDERSVLVETGDRVVQVDLESGDMTETGFPEYSSVYDLTQSGEDTVFLFSRKDRDVTDLWVTAGKEPVRLTELNPELKALPRGESRLIHYRSQDGEELKGALLLPPDYEEGKKYPMAAFVYGGSVVNSAEGAFSLGFSPVSSIQQLLSRCGYIVLKPSIPLGPAGEKGSPFQNIPKSVVPAVNKVVEMGLADPERLGAIGQSYGGYTVNALITQTGIFQAAAALAGISDLISNYGVFDARYRYTGGASSFFSSWSEGGQGRMGTPPWNDRMRWVENSPVFYLDRITTPLLLIHGDLDFVAIQQAEEMFSGLKRLGKEAEFVRYFGEGHVLSKPVNIRDSWHRVAAWFDRYLKKQHGCSY